MRHVLGVLAAATVALSTFSASATQYANPGLLCRESPSAYIGALTWDYISAQNATISDVKAYCPIVSVAAITKVTLRVCTNSSAYGFLQSYSISYDNSVGELLFIDTVNASGVSCTSLDSFPPAYTYAGTVEAELQRQTVNGNNKIVTYVVED